MITALDWAWLGRKPLLAEMFLLVDCHTPVTGLLGKRLRIAPVRSLNSVTCSLAASTGEGYLRPVAHIMRHMLKETNQ
jgi:hypothetical protein